eukprot:scaffold47745_cov68-Phaeocystis_antarctica.AAC.1
MRSCASGAHGPHDDLTHTSQGTAGISGPSKDTSNKDPYSLPAGSIALRYEPSTGKVPSFLLRNKLSRRRGAHGSVRFCCPSSSNDERRGAATGAGGGADAARGR